jgi:HEXXH motif-containing protein
MTSNHTLSAAEFSALAAGDPDAAVIDKLLTAQFSKRIVMLRAILELAASRCRSAYPALDEAFGVLAQAQATDRAAVRAVLTHPSVGTWAARCLHRLQAADDSPVPLEAEIGQFAAVAAAAAIAADQAFELTVPLRDGAVMLTGLGLATFTSCPANAAATISFDHGKVRIIAGDHTVTMPADPADDADGWLGLRRLRSHAADASITFEFDDIDPSRNAHGNALAPRGDQAAIGAWQATLDQAWEILATQYPRRAAALAAGFQVIIPLQEKARTTGASVTARDGFGAIVMTPPKAGAQLADTLIHEFHHSVLYAVMDMVTLHTAGPAAEHYSPWRDDPRPIQGLLHGAYAYLGVVDFWRGQRNALGGPELRYADFEFARWRGQVAWAARVLLDSGLLTEPGETFVKGMAATAARWLDLPVDELAQRLADRTAADHHVSWRVRNRRPDPAAVSAIADAWLAGQPCPVDPDTVPVTVAPAPRRLALGDRVRLCGLRLKDSGAVSAAKASAGDIAYVLDDFAAARAEFQAAIASDPAGVESWSGLALTLTALGGERGITRSPEVARAVCLSIAHQSASPDIAALGRWLAQAPVGAPVRANAQATVYPPAHAGPAPVTVAG